MAVSNRRSNKVWIVLSLVLISAFIVLFFPKIWTSFWLYKESNAITRGKNIAFKLGCFSCHGSDGMNGVLNPKHYKKKSVPTWGGGTFMMYLKTPEEIREYILDGFPKRKRNIPDLWEKYQKAKIHMPAYRDKVSGKKLDDLLTYVEAVIAWEAEEIEDPSIDEGRQLTLKWNCFNCHGVDGSGGPNNPGSFSGFIPGWLGSAYDELVQSDKELREWIKKGKIERIEKHPVAGYFLEHQTIKMPSYESELSEEQISQIISYIKWLRNKYSQ